MSYIRPPRNGKIIRYESRARDLNLGTRASEDISIDDIYSQLKRDVKRTSIISRMHQKKNASVALRRGTEYKQPANDELSKAEGLRDLKRIYEKEQQRVGSMLAQQQLKQSPVKKQQQQDRVKIKEGLLGQYKYYERMEKPQLIEKLIALQYLTQKLYKRNKHLEQQAQTNKGTNPEGGATEDCLNRTIY